MGRVDQRDIMRWQPRETPKHEITYTLEMECRLAAAWAGYPYEMFLSLPGSDRWVDENGGDSQAGVLVAWRIAKRIEAIQSEVSIPQKGKHN